MNTVKFFGQIHTEDLNLVGGKAFSLGLMTSAGLPVPAGFVVTTDVHDYYKSNGVLSLTLVDEMLRSFDKLQLRRVAVRSSATSEDSQFASWAGQFESYMNVEKSDLIEKIEQCWESVSGAVDYARTQNMDETSIRMAVVVQIMVDSEISGVAFSVNPLNHNVDEVMIEATYGLGEPLVQGMVTPDNYVVSKSSRSQISSRIANKGTMLVYQDNMTKDIVVAEDMASKPCLTEDQLTTLCSLVSRIEDYYECPQDVEWAYQSGNFYIVQSRPITTL